MEDRAPEGVTRVRAGNPSPYTLDGTNTYVVDGWVVDPGPDEPAHLDRVAEAAGQIAGIALTHDHPDHSEGAPALAERAGVPVWRPRGGERAGPLEAIATPGHAPDHVALRWRGVVFAGDTVLGAGSVFVAPGDGAMAAYLDSLRRLRELDGLEVIAPGHGPFVWDPVAKIDEYIAHRLEREQRVLDAIAAGARTRDELLDAAWDDVPFAQAPVLRVAAGVTLDAHLEKLRDEGRLAGGLEV